MNYPDFTVEKLREILDFNPEIGIFIWKRKPAIKSKKIFPGKKADIIRRKYLGISLNYKIYPSHRLAWMYVYGCYPTGAIDHINRNGHDNRISNLREATWSDNSCNRAIQSNNTTGFKGVFFNKKYKNWYVVVMKKRKAHYGGHFNSPEKAAISYDKLAIKVHGQFAQLNFPESRFLCHG